MSGMSLRRTDVSLLFTIIIIIIIIINSQCLRFPFSLDLKRFCCCLSTKIQTLARSGEVSRFGEGEWERGFCFASVVFCNMQILRCN